MTVVRTKTPTLAWLLAALTCLLTGMAIVESRHQTVTLTVLRPVGMAEPAATANASAPTVAPPPPPTTRFADAPMPPSTGPARLRAVRHTVAAGGRLPSAVALGPTVLLVETGTIAVGVDGVTWVGEGVDEVRNESVLRSGERLVIAPNARYDVRNDGPASAVVLVAAMVTGVTPTPMAGSGKGLP